MSSTLITPAFGPVERAGQSALRRQLRHPRSRGWKPQLRLWLRTWEKVIVAEVLARIDRRRYEQ